MNSQNISISHTDKSLNTQDTVDVEEREKEQAHHPTEPPVDNGKRFLNGISPFWHDRLLETGLIVSMLLYYLIGNGHFGTGFLFRLNPLIAVPFLIVFIVLCWYRLSFVVALLPLTLPFYALQKTVFSHYSFSLVEITLGVSVCVALLQLVIQRKRWPYWISWRELRDRPGPLIIPILIFLAMSAFSIVIAYQQKFAFRAFYEEVLSPIVYLFMMLVCLRTRKDLARVLGALLATGVLVALIGLGQYFFFKNQLVLESDGIRRIHAMYGSANSVGLLFDYIMPIGFAWILARTHQRWNILASWKGRIAGALICLPMLGALILTQSVGAWVAIGVAAAFVAALSIRSRKTLLVAIVLGLVVVAVAALFFHTRIINFITSNHPDVHGVSTTTKRIYLWESALNMIRDSPWFGYGMDNWLCHYSYNTICQNHLFHYLIARDPVTHQLTDLKFEPDLSHPHNIFLHVWVSIGIFGLLAFIAMLAFFYGLFIRILRNLRLHETNESLMLQWMTLGVGAAMLAALVQGMVDSSFLEQDLSFCFWLLVGALLLLRVFSGTPWRGRLKKE